MFDCNDCVNLADGRRVYAPPIYALRSYMHGEKCVWDYNELRVRPNRPRVFPPYFRGAAGMKSKSHFLVWAIALSFLTGCGGKGSASSTAAAGKTVGAVGIIDLDKVAADLGRTKEMEGQIQQAGTGLMGQLQEKLKAAQKQFENEKFLVGANPTDEQKRHLATVEANLNKELTELQQLARVRLNEYQVKVIVDFKNEVKEHALDVARAQGLSSVCIKNEAFLYVVVDDTVDITARVVERMQAAKAAAATEAPKTDAPTEAPKSE